MKYINVAGTELNPSALCLGTGGFGASLTESESYRQMDCFFEKGGNFFDTARIYSDWIPGEKARSECIIGRYLVERKNRDHWLLSTKGGHPALSTMHIPRLSRKDLISDIDESLKTLRTNYIDLYYLHRDNTKLPVEEIIDWMNEFVIDGKIRYFGCSNWKTERIIKAQKYAKNSGKKGFCVNQPLWNIGCYTMSPHSDLSLIVMDKKMMALHREMELAVIPYSSQAGGFFSRLSSNDKALKKRALQNKFNII